MRARAFTAALAVTAMALVLTSCGTGNTAGSTPPGGIRSSGSPQQQSQDHNQADISFAQAMIPHHAQAIQMAQQAADRAQSPPVKDLASRIEQAQAPEIETITTWLRAWNAEVPPSGASSGDHGGGMGMGGMDSQQMSHLGQATGAEFDLLFLQMMIKHHEGAVEMARIELENGQNPEATQLAQQIIDTQQAEIEEMQALLPQG